MAAVAYQSPDGDGGGGGAGGSVSERGSKGGLAPEWMDGGSHGQREGERDHTETVCSERENTAEPTQPP